jgi:hypothetical protein
MFANVAELVLQDHFHVGERVSPELSNQHVQPFKREHEEFIINLQTVVFLPTQIVFVGGTCPGHALSTDAAY